MNGPTPGTGPVRQGGPVQQAGPVRQRSWLEVRWRQFRNAPPPVTRAVAANLLVALVLAIPLLGYDVAVRRGAALPGGDLRTPAVAAFVAAVVGAGSLLTYAWVPLPAGSGGHRRRSPWSGALGFFAALPIAYLVLVAAFQLLEPWILGG